MNSDPHTPSGAPSDSEAVASAPRAGRTRVWVLNMALAAAAVAFDLAVGRHLPSPHDGITAVPLVGLAAIFTLTEIFVVHLRFRHDAHTFSLSEIPLVLGLFSVSPTTLLWSQVLGGGAVLALYRRQRPVKLAFNLACYAVSILAAESVFHAVLGGGQALGPRGWLAGGAAAVTASGVAVPAIYMAVTLSDGRPAAREFLRPFAFALFGAVVTSSVGLLAVELLAARPLAGLLLVVPTLGLYTAHRAYVGEREKHHSLQFLYDSTRLLNQSPELDSAIDAMLAQARDALRADIAVLTYHPADSDRLLRARIGPGAEHEAMTEAEPQLVAELWAGLEPTARSAVFHSGSPSEAVRRLVGGVELRDGILVALQGETQVIGMLMVANRVSEVSGFQPSDVRLLETLGAHLGAALENGRLEQSLAQLQVLQRELAYQANHDALTSLADRSLFSHALTDALEHVSEESGLAVLFVDLDDFKTVNDSLGHDAGDSLLVAVAQRLASCLREHDVAARLGGDEFGVLLRGVDGVTTAVSVAERILATLSQPVSVYEQALMTHASIGIAASKDDDDASTLMRNADTAMYVAKARGKGCWALFSPEMHEAALERQDLIRDLVRAFDEDELVVHFQPMVGVQEEGVVAAEALIRWAHPTRGLLGPASFIGIVEETGLMSRLTRMVLRRACTLAREWPADPLSGTVPAVSVNLSALDFDNPDLVGIVLSTLHETGLPPERLILEVTETLLLNDAPQSIETLRQLAATGVRIALDDFGTGYSSLNYLAQLPLHWLKIAKPFIDDLGRDDAHDAMARGILELGHILGLGIIAEGIESPGQLDALRAFGCDVGQGFLHSRPLASDHFRRWLETRMVPEPLGASVD